jgi:hypothetical protein
MNIVQRHLENIEAKRIEQIRRLTEFAYEPILDRRSILVDSPQELYPEWTQINNRPIIPNGYFQTTDHVTPTVRW